MITVLSPDRVVIGGGVAAAGDLLFAPIRDELAARVRTTSLDAVELVPAELGIWAGAIGAAVHGAERAAGRPSRQCRRERRARRPPHWRRIERTLRERIHELAPGDPLPSDTELCDEFGVSRMTARNAMQRLADEGLIVRDPGTRQLRRGAAGPPPRRPADDVLARDGARRAGAPTLAGARPRDPAVDGRRGGGARASSPSEPVVVVRRVRCADGEPIAVETARLLAPDRGRGRWAPTSSTGRCTRRSPAAATTCGAAPRRSRAERRDARGRAPARHPPGRPAARRAARDLRRPRPPPRGDREPLSRGPVRARRAVRGRGRHAVGRGRAVTSEVVVGRLVLADARRPRPGHDRGRLDRGGRAATRRTRRRPAAVHRPGLRRRPRPRLGRPRRDRRRERPDRHGPGPAAPGRDLVPARRRRRSPRPSCRGSPSACARGSPTRPTTGRSRWASTSRARSSRRRARAPTTRRSCARPTSSAYEAIGPLLDGLRVMTIAPELPGALALIERLSALGIVASLGHSASTLDEARAGLRRGRPVDDPPVQRDDAASTTGRRASRSPR